MSLCGFEGPREEWGWQSSTDTIRFFCDDCFERERQDERKNPEPVSDVWVWEFSFPKRSFLVIVFGGNRIGMSWS
jgi:hypothetical protein